MSPNPKLDPYTANAQNDDITPAQKITDLHKLVESAKTGMLTSRASNGQLHSRAMTPAGPVSPTQVNLVFIANNASFKFEEFQNDSNVNVSFFDTSSTNWASFAGRAQIITDKAVIKQHWSSLTAAYFGDLGDGIHKGDENDPRVVAIEVIPDEIRYWVATSGAVGRSVKTAVASVTGKGSAPGELRTITKEEVCSDLRVFRRLLIPTIHR
ncbi:hypothetical protein FA95DRAFT_1551217 [Auriscalpium vulgare]|uniref:Uncharacterized protein n=1 Tax=Auriscalpium vulgare TaxID=40419 RepID=A0ACB8R321_9AGAM|nr:hypothetical protein FA95DRAFT_1551217 [Auriscalpium vulgare]